MEHLFDSLSKELAQAVSRRQAAKAFVSGTVGLLLASLGLRNSTLQAAGPCTICGTCEIYDLATGKSQPCTTCGAQGLCNAAQSNAAYKALAADLMRRAYIPTGYRSLIAINGTSKTYVFDVTYALPSNPTYSADLFVIWSANRQVIQYSIEYNNHKPIYGYQVTAGGIEQIIPPILPSAAAVTVPAETSAAAVTPESLTQGECKVLVTLLCGAAVTTACQLRRVAIAAAYSGALTLPAIITFFLLVVTCSIGAAACVALSTATCGCPPKHIPCLTGCCLSCDPTACAAGGGACQNGVCVLQTCAFGTTACGIHGCCGAGYSCCDPSSPFGGCLDPRYTTCCGTTYCSGANLLCCPNGNSCCNHGQTCCGGFCCSSGEHCCQVTLPDGTPFSFCCPAASTCCNSSAAPYTCC